MVGGKNEKMKLYFHVGKHKTGSSSIQTFLYRNRNVLAQRGICYPDICDSHAQNYVNGRTLFCMLNSGKVVRSEKIIRESIQQAKSLGCSRILISNESFTPRSLLRDPSLNHANLTAEKLKELFSALELETKIVVYIRPFIEYVVSFWNTEIIKNGMDLGLEDYIEHYRYEDELDRIHEYGRIFGMENIILRPFEREQFKNNNLMEDFLDCMGLELDDDFEIPENANESFDRSTLDLLRTVNELKLDKHVRRKLYAKVISRQDRSRPRPIETLPDDMIERLSKRYQNAENSMATIFLGRDHLFINSLPKCYGKEREPYEGLSGSQVHELMMDVVHLAKTLYPTLKIAGASCKITDLARKIFKHNNKRRLSKIGAHNR